MAAPAQTHRSRFVRLAHVCKAHPWLTFGAWLVALVLLQGIAAGVGTKKISSFRLPGTESQRAYDLLADHFPAAKGDTDQIVYRAKRGTLQDAATKRAIDASLKEVAANKDVASVASPFGKGGQLTKDGRIGVATLNYKESTNDIDLDPLKAIQDDAFAARSASLQVEHGGPGAEVVRFGDQQGSSELVGVVL